MDTTPSTQVETSSGASFHYSLDEGSLQQFVIRCANGGYITFPCRIQQLDTDCRDGLPKSLPCRIQQLDTDCRDGLPKSLPCREDMEARQRGQEEEETCSSKSKPREMLCREDMEARERSVHRWDRDRWNCMVICSQLSQEEEICSSKRKPREMLCREDMEAKQRRIQQLDTDWWVGLLKRLTFRIHPWVIDCFEGLPKSSPFREDMEAKQRSLQPLGTDCWDRLLKGLTFREDMDEKQRREDMEAKQRRLQRLDTDCRDGMPKSLPFREEKDQKQRVGLLAPLPTLLHHPGLGLAGYPSGLNAKLVLLSFLLYCVVTLAYSLKDEKLSFCRLSHTSQLDCRLECQFYEDIYKGRHTFQVYHIRQEGSPDIVAEGRWIEGEYTVYTADGYEHNGTEISKVFIKIQKRSVHVGSMYACILPPVELEDVSTCHLPGEDLSNVNMALHKSSSSNEGSALLSSVPETPAVSPSSAKLTVAQDMAQLLIIAVSIITFS